MASSRRAVVDPIPAMYRSNRPSPLKSPNAWLMPKLKRVSPSCSVMSVNLPFPLFRYKSSPAKSLTLSKSRSPSPSKSTKDPLYVRRRPLADKPGRTRSLGEFSVAIVQ